MSKPPITEDFILNLDNNVFDDNPSLKVIPEFAILTDRQMKYTMLVAWLGTPLRRMKPDDRKLRAALMAGYKMEKDGVRPDKNTRNLIDGKVGAVEAALRVWKDIQHDPERELKNALDSQINEIIEFLKIKDKSPQLLEKAVSLMTKLPQILETRKKIMEVLDTRLVVEDDMTETVKETRSNSVLEDMNENEYEEF